jgi:hypothetical protein
MNTVLYTSPDGVVGQTAAYSRADIARLVDDCRLDSLASADRQFDFWVTSSIRPCHLRINRSATELLLATTRFTAKTVPLLRGTVVVATHDCDGALDGLSWLQLDLLAARNRTVTWWDRRVLLRRIARDSHDQQLLTTEPAVIPRYLQHRPNSPS